MPIHLPDRIPVKEIERYEKTLLLPKDRHRCWWTCLLTVLFCSLYFSLQKSYEIISMSNRKRGFPTSAASRLSGRWGAYRSVQVLLASRLRVQRYGGLRHHARKYMKKVVVFVKTGHFSAFRLCKPYGKRPFSGISEGFSGLPGAFRRRNEGNCASNARQKGRKRRQAEEEDIIIYK